MKIPSGSAQACVCALSRGWVTPPHLRTHTRALAFALKCGRAPVIVKINACARTPARETCGRTCACISAHARIARPMTHLGRVYVRMSLPAARAPTLATHPFYCMQLLFLEISACRPRLGVGRGRSGSFELLLLLFSSLVFSTCQVVHQAGL